MFGYNFHIFAFRRSRAASFDVIPTSNMPKYMLFTFASSASFGIITTTATTEWWIYEQFFGSFSTVPWEMVVVAAIWFARAQLTSVEHSDGSFIRFAVCFFDRIFLYTDPCIIRRKNAFIALAPPRQWIACVFVRLFWWSHVLQLPASKRNNKTKKMERN